MKIGIKIFLQLILVIFIVLGIVGYYFYWQSSLAMKNLLRSQLKNTAASYTEFFNGDDFEKIQSKADEQKVEYKLIQKKLKEIAAANDDIVVAYTMRLLKDKVVFVVDVPLENLEGEVTYAHPGEEYPEATKELLEGFVRPSADQEPFKDDWGYFLSGYAPIYNSAGRPIAMLGIDMTVDHIQKKMRYLKLTALFSIILSVILSLIMVTLLTLNILNPIKELSIAFNSLSSGNLNYRIKVKRSDEFGELQNGFNNMIDKLEEAEVIKGIFGKYINPEVIKQVRKNGIELGGKGVEVTVLFVDIKDFVKLSQQSNPYMIVYLLNKFFPTVVASIRKYNGIVDKYLGDAAMVVFGTPITDKNHASNAIGASIAIKKALVDLNAELRGEGSPEINIGIGIDSGNVIAGNIGSKERMEYTIIGNPVNLACRLSEKAKELNNFVVISANTFNRLKSSQYSLKESGQVILKGIEKPINIYVM